MSLLSKKRLILSKIESTVGTDSTPSSTTDAMLVKSLNVTPMDAETANRDVIRAFLGNSEALVVRYNSKIEFEVELAGSGTVGLAPAYDSLLRACAFTKTVTTSPVSITRTGTTATATLASHGYAVGDKVVISGAAQTDYNITATIIAVTTNTFDYTVANSPVTPATGSPVAQTSVVYTPVSSNFESATIYYYIGADSGTNATLHKLTGCFGSVEISANVKGLPSMKFSFQGIYNNPTDVTMPSSINYNLFQRPLAVLTANTPGFTLYGYSGLLESFSLNMSNDVKHRVLVGYEGIKLLDRKPSGSLSFEAPMITTKDFWSLVKSGTTGAMNFAHGNVNGNKVIINCPSVMLQNPSYSESDNIFNLTTPYTIQPVNGNDEITITVK